MATRKKEPTARADRPDSMGLAGISVIKDIAIGAFGRADAKHVAVICLCAFGAVLGLVMCVMLASAGQHGFAFSAFVMSVVLLLAGLVALRFGTAREVGMSTHGNQDARVMWARRVPRTPIPEDSVETLRQSVEAIRNHAFRWLSEQGVRVHPEDVRANIFFPYCADAPAPDVCALKIHPQLHSGMENHPDLGITFRPGQGLCGDVFRTGEAKVAETLVDKTGAHSFTELHQLTAKQKEQAHPDLRWIVSLPLTVPSDSGVRRCGAVLNVDGLRHQVGTAQLKLLLGSLMPSTAQLSNTLEKLPGLMIRITHQEV